MAKDFTTLNVSTTLKTNLRTLAERIAKKEGLSKISMAQLIERMKKVYEDNIEL